MNWFAVCPCGVRIRLPERFVRRVLSPCCPACHQAMTYVQEAA